MNMKNLQKFFFLSAFCFFSVSCENQAFVQAAFGGGYDPYDTARASGYMSDLEKDIIMELNRCRADPVNWCLKVGLNGGEVMMNPSENSLSMRALPAVGLLEPRKGLYRAAKDLCVDIAASNNAFHRLENFNDYGKWGGGIAQNCSPPFSGWRAQYHISDSVTDAQVLVYVFIRDGGNPGKGHRTNIMNGSWKHVGVSVVNGACVMNFAASYTDNSGI